MKLTEFFSPADGDIIANPDLLVLKILFLYVGAEYWNSGSGDSYIQYKDGRKTSRLEILFSEDLGFYLRYKTAGTDLHSINDDGDYSKVVKVYVGGDPLILPVKFFIDREIALEAVKVFCESGDPTSKVKWLEHNKVEWDWDKYL